MLWKKTGRFWKGGLTAISFMLILSISGCRNVPSEETEGLKKESEFLDILQDVEDDADEIADICLDLYQKVEKKNSEDELEMIRSIVSRFEEYGYPAVDSKNQINMTETEQVIRFCEKVDAQEKAEIAIFVVDGLDGLIKYDLQAEDGNVEVTRSYYVYENGTIQRNFVGSYPAEDWSYTKEGYLMFSGTYFSEELYALTLSGMEEHTALRVEPLDEKYRELNRKYLLSVGYEYNNMFITDWNEQNFGELDFYDMYDLFYAKVNAEQNPYVADDNLGVGAVYQIAKEEFEDVIMPYFKIDSETLQSKTVYHTENSTYEYKPRGFEEIEYPEYPFSEVTGFTENSDGTITLTVNVVFPYSGNSKEYTHEVVVRSLEDGGVQYVSNKILPTDDNCEKTWYTPRLTVEEWEELYGGE